MNEKEKANELANKFVSKSVFDMTDEELKIERIRAKQCALIAVDEIIEFLTQASEYLAFPEQIKYWQEVRKEIEAL
jgi:hypothetical protein